MTYALHRPRGWLANYIACFWYSEGIPQGHAQEQLMPSGEASAVFNLRDDPIRIYNSRNRETSQSYGCAVIAGPRTCPFVIDSAQQERVFGIQFRAGGSWPFFPLPVSELANQNVALDDLWHASKHQLREQLLSATCPSQMFLLAERHLFAALPRQGKPHAAVEYAVACLMRNPQEYPLSRLINDTGLSHRRFQQIFRDRVGLAPKAFSRVRRFQQVLTQVHKQRRVNWTQVALDCGYYDQPHFNHDFREFSGFAPGIYLARATEHLNHVPLD